MPPSNIGSTGDGDGGSNGNGQAQGSGGGRQPSTVPGSDGNNDENQSLEPSDEDDESFYLSSNGSASEEDDDEDNNAQEAGDNGNNDLKRKINQLTVRMNKFQEKKDHYKEEFKNAQTRVRNLKRENKCLRKQLEDKRISAPPTPWQERLQAYLRGEPAPSYERIYRDCCKQENMSMNLTITHPDITIVVRTLHRDEIEAGYRRPGGDRCTVFYILTGRIRCPAFLAIILPRIFTRARPLILIEVKPFPFEQLPNSLQSRIFRMVFDQRTLVHCLSRLDKSGPPPELHFDERRTGLPHKFHMSTRPCCVTTARKPYNVLRPLMVSKRWLFIGVHAFYGINTFAFSSLGELGKFFNGIGRARVERIQHLELMWHGNLMHPGAQLIKQENGKQRLHKVSKRTLPLRWFTQTRRLRTLLVHIAESDRRRVRRGYEMKSDSNWDQDEQYEKAAIQQLETFGQMVKRTSCQPNFRKYRSLRTVQGIDCVYQLRGMKWVRFKDVSAPGRRTNVRDWSFLNDVNSVCTQPKPYKYGRQSELYRLTQISGLGDWDPSEDDLEMIKGFYEEGPVEGLPGGSVASGSILGSIFNAHPDSSEFEDDEDIDDSDAGGNGTGGGGGNGEDAASAIVIDDSDSDSDSDSDHDEGHSTIGGSSAGPQSDPTVMSEETSSEGANPDSLMFVDPAQSATNSDSPSSSTSESDDDDDEPMEGAQTTQNTTIPADSGHVIDLVSDDDEDGQHNNKGKAPGDDNDDAKTDSSGSTNSTKGTEEGGDENENENEDDAGSRSESLFVPMGSHYAETVSSARSQDGRAQSHLPGRTNRHGTGTDTTGTDTSMGPPRRGPLSAREIKDESSSDNAALRRPIVDLTGDDDGFGKVKWEMGPPPSSSSAASSKKRPHGGEPGASAPTKRSRPNPDSNSDGSFRPSPSPVGLTGALRKRLQVLHGNGPESQSGSASASESGGGGGDDGGGGQK